MGLWGAVDGVDISIPVIGVSGEKSSGKSIFVSSIDPKGTCMVDLEGSTVTYQFPFKERHDLYKEMLAKSNGEVPKAVDSFIWFYELVRSIEPKQFTVLAIDPITDIEQGMVDYVKANPARFGRTSNQYEKASGLLWADVNAFWKTLIGILAEKVETFAFTAHMRFVWKGSTPTDRREAKGKSVLFEISSLYMHLERKPNSKGNLPAAPRAVAAHPLGKSRVAANQVLDSGEIKIIPLLPPAFDNCTPATIRSYIQSPPDFKKLKVGERFTVPEMSDDERLELQAQIEDRRAESARDELAKAELLVASGARTAATAAAPAKTADALRAAASEKQSAPETEKPSGEDGAVVVTGENNAKGNVESDTSERPPREEMLSYIKSCWVAEGVSKDVAKARIEKVGGEGATLKDLSDDQVFVLYDNAVPF